MIEPKPIFVINFKAYQETIGKNALHLARICEKVAIQTGADIRIAVAATDLANVTDHVTIPVYSEHVDEYPLGKHTGAILPEMVKAAGATGTLINHSEFKIPMKKLEDSIKRAEDLSLVTIVCADTLEEETKILGLSRRPDFIAIEPPELIGGDISVSTAKPELITRSVDEANKLTPHLRVLVGAGVKNHLDVKKAMELGAAGVLVASGIDLAKDPEVALRELIS
jgi:triosephosphate isomerase (TIM)